MNDDVRQLRLVDDEHRASNSAPEVGSGHLQEKPAATARRGRSLAEFGEVLTVEEAATVLRISRASAYAAVRVWRTTHADGIPVVQIGRRLLVPRAMLEELLSAPSRCESAHHRDRD